MTNTLNPTLQTIVDWIEEIRRLECASFADVALRSPEIWSAIRAHASTRRTIAQSCGWPLMLSREEIEAQPAELLGVALLNIGIDCPMRLWVYVPRMCHLMHLQGKLQGAFALMQASVGETTDDEEDSLDDAEVCRRGFLEAGLRLDFEGVKRALASRGEASLRRLLPMMPEEGVLTEGGWVLDVPSLIVARVLEHAQIPFEVADAVRDPSARAARAVGFHLPRENVVLAFGSSRNAQHEMLPAATPRIVFVDDRLLDSDGWLNGFLCHIVESLADVGVSADIRAVNLSSFVQLSPIKATVQRS